MNIFEIIIMNILFILFPLMIWILYQVYSKTMDIKKSRLFLDFALISSMYLIIRFGTCNVENLPILFFNIPLLIGYIKHRRVSILILSLGSIFYYNIYLQFNPFLLVLEYVLYFLINLSKMKQKTFIYSFLLIKMIFILIQFYINPDLLSLIGYQSMDLIIIFIIFCFISSFVIFLFQASEQIIEVHLKYCELEQQKDITDSLFQITHEIKNPIAVCKGYLDMFDVSNIEHSKKYIPILKEEIDRLLILLQDFLSINKIKINLDVVDINLLLEDMLKTFLPIFRAKNIQTDFRIDEDEFYILADYNRLSQVLINLIKNSMEAIPKDRSGVIGLWMKKYPSMIKIYVTDNGEGISKKNLEKLKSPFFTTKTRGTGLGVYLCNEIIEAHHGTIKYYSKKNEGTKVVITLPYHKKDIKNLS